MAYTVRRADYFYTKVEDRPGEGHRLLTQVADMGVSLLAFAAVPIGPVHTQLTLFPDDAERMASAARKAGITSLWRSSSQPGSLSKPALWRVSLSSPAASRASSFFWSHSRTTGGGGAGHSHFAAGSGGGAGDSRDEQLRAGSKQAARAKYLMVG